MSQYASTHESASVTRQATPDELWLDDQLERIDANASEMGGDVSYTRAIETLVFELRDERDESDGVREILAKHLAGVAIALKGPELELHKHGYHDLEEKAQVAMIEIELLKHENQRLEGEASVMRALLGEVIDFVDVNQDGAVTLIKQIESALRGA
jgi:hypothetical protein